MSVRPFPQTTAVTIGNFDGVHVGHAALVAAARRAADAAAGRSAQGRVVALVFDPNPITLLKPDAAAPQRLSTFDQRARWLIASGADEVVRLEPTLEFLSQSPDAFIEWLVERWQPVAIVEGADFRFGRGRSGSVKTLQDRGSARGFTTVVVDGVEVSLRDQSIVRASSTITRWLIARGRVDDASVVLGRSYEIEARVVRGDQRGRTIGFPTANLSSTDQLLPADGIYAGIALRDGREWPAAISVGTKPTFGEHPRTCEAFLLDYDGPVDDYGWDIRLRFTRWLRDQLRYDTVEALITQLRRDVAATQRCADTRPETPVLGLSRSARA